MTESEDLLEYEGASLLLADDCVLERDDIIKHQTILVGMADASIDKLEKCSEDIRNISKLIKRIQAERRHIEAIQIERDCSGIQNMRSSNIHLYQLFVDKLITLPGIIAVLEVMFDNQDNKITVDIIFDGGASWMKVFCRNPQAIHATCFGYDREVEKSVLATAQRYLALANSNKHNFQVPKIHFYFGRGVTEQVRDNLEKGGIIVEGTIVGLTDATKLQMLRPSDESGSGSSDECEPVIAYPQAMDEEFCRDRVNLDVSTMIAMISELTHGGHVYDFDDSYLDIPAKLERARRLLPVLNEFFKDKELLVCETALKECTEINDLVGGPKEKERLSELVKRLTVVKDSPSERAMQLKTSCAINPRNKIIFGTGDSLRVLTSTSNTRFLRAAAQQGCQFAVHLHDSYPLRLDRFLRTLRHGHEGRALSERKQANAKRIGDRAERDQSS